MAAGSCAAVPLSVLMPMRAARSGRAPMLSPFQQHAPRLKRHQRAPSAQTCLCNWDLKALRVLLLPRAQELWAQTPAFLNWTCREPAGGSLLGHSTESVGMLCWSPRVALFYRLCI